MSRTDITPTDVFKDQALADILSWAHYVKYHDVYYYDDKNIIITYLEPTTYTAYVVYYMYDNSVPDFVSDYMSHLINMGYHCVYLTESHGDLTHKLRAPITLGHMHDMFSNTEFTHRVIL